MSARLIRESLLPEEITVEQILPDVELDVRYDKVIAICAATWDLFPGHHDPVYARAQGQRTIYLNTLVLAGFLDRIVLEWAGPRWFLRRRAMRMTRSVCAGDALVGRGSVVATGLDKAGASFVDLKVEGSTEEGTCVDGDITIVLSA